VTHDRGLAARDLISKSIAGSPWFNSNWHHPRTKYAPQSVGSRGLTRMTVSPSATLARGSPRNSHVQANWPCTKWSLAPSAIAVSNSIRDSVKRF